MLYERQYEHTHTYAVQMLYNLVQYRPVLTKNSITPVFANIITPVFANIRIPPVYANIRIPPAFANVIPPAFANIFHRLLQIYDSTGFCHLPE